MNIEILSLFSNQYGIEYTWSNNGGDESEIQKMSKDDFAKLLCDYSDENIFLGDEYVTLKQYTQISEDNFEDFYCSVLFFVSDELDRNYDYCKECLVKYLQSQNKN